MNPQVNKVLTIVTSPIPALFCVLSCILPHWIPWCVFLTLLIVGIIVWRKYNKKTLGITCIALAMAMVVVGVYGVKNKAEQIEIASLGEDPLMSFFELNQDAQNAWDTQDVHLAEIMATTALQKSIELGIDKYSFSYYDNIWKKFEAAKREGSSNACHNMAFMCANGLGRIRSIDDAIELCYKAISLNPSSNESYLMLEKLQVDSAKYPDVYIKVKEWRVNIDKEDSILSKKFGEVAGFYGILKEGDDMITQTQMREKSFEKVLYADTSSQFWTLIDENVDILRTLAISGNVSYHTLYLAAYYYGMGMCDSAVYFYDRFMGADGYWRAMTGHLASLYGFVPDTVISAYSRNIMPLLIGLSCPDLDYLASSVGGDKNWPERGLVGADALNQYFMNTLDLALALKNNRYNFTPTNPFYNYKSNIEDAVARYKSTMAELLKNKRCVIGKEKSRKYNYNFLVDIHNEHLEGIIPQNKLSGYGLFTPQNYDTTLIFTNVLDGDIMKRVNEAASRAAHGRNLSELLH